MERGDIEQINQLISTLEEPIGKLEIYHEKRDSENFEKAKKFSRNIFEKISEMVK